MTATSEPTRQYRVQGVLGKGGFGTVYRATLENSDGFRKEVALKVLNSDTMPDTFLARFRDEARMLGLVRDRAVVAVDPPMVLNGQVTLVMEFVDGESGARLAKRHRHLPVRVTADIIQEIARALDSVYTQPGPNGQPLKLLHRDIKPANIQITPGGSVKVLDFGIAKATFDQRESATTKHVMGTLRYMAPERIEGFEGPYGDVFSLGCVFRYLMLGDKPLGLGKWKVNDIVERTPVIDEAVAFIDRMTDLAYEDRPSINEVEEFCSQLSTKAGGESLRQWARTAVKSSPIKHDQSTGTILREQGPVGRPLGAPVAEAKVAVTPGIAETVPVPTPPSMPSESTPQRDPESGTSRKNVVLAGGFLFTTIGGFAAVVAVVAVVAYFAMSPANGPDVIPDPGAAAPAMAEQPRTGVAPAPLAVVAETPEAPDPSAEVAVAAPEPQAAVAVAPAAAPAPAQDPAADLVPALEPAEIALPEPVAEEPAAAEEPAPAQPSVSVRLDGLVAVFVDSAGNRVGADALQAQIYTAMVAFDPAKPGDLVDVGTLDLTNGEGSIRCSSTSKRCSIAP